jgi:hypothetical protein
MPRRDAISDTLRQRVLSALHFGTLRAGSRLPSARVLAAELKADPRVVTAAYRSLESEGVVERRPPSRAYFVVGRGPPPERSPPLPNGWWRCSPAASRAACPPPTFRSTRGDPSRRCGCGPPASSANRDQLTWLCRELHEDYGVAAAEVEVDAIRHDEPPPPSVRSADLLVTTRRHADVARRLGDRVGKPVVVATIRPDLAAEIERLIAEGPLYFVGRTRGSSASCARCTRTPRRRTCARCSSGATTWRPSPTGRRPT